MKIVKDVHTKLRAYSFWSILLGLICFVVPEYLIAYTAFDPDPFQWGRAGLFLQIFGLIGWAIDQRERSLWRGFKLALISMALAALVVFSLTGSVFAMGEGAVIETIAPPKAERLPTWEETAVVVMPITKRWEGLETTAYLDRIARPPVWTVCYGETFNVTPRETRTVAQCDAGLRKGLKRYWQGYRRGVTASYMPVTVDAAMTDLTWNIGQGAALKSSALKAINRHDFPDACHYMTYYNRSGGRIVKGLVNRRAFANGVCLSGLT